MNAEKNDICSPNGCMHCPYQDSAYCPYEAEFPLSLSIVIFVMTALFCAGPFILYLMECGK
mgnify:CR=1 FL=1